jgi:hypothetical protein
VRITSVFGGGEFRKTLRKVCTCQKLKFSFLLLEYCKIRECYAVANAYEDGRLKMIDIKLFCQALKMTWIKKYIDPLNIYP